MRTALKEAFKNKENRSVSCSVVHAQQRANFGRATVFKLLYSFRNVFSVVFLIRECQQRAKEPLLACASV